MPRRNRNARARRLVWATAREVEDRRPLSTDEMARQLVTRGLATNHILDGYKPRRPLTDTDL